jgi:fructuronate reductase
MSRAEALQEKFGNPYSREACGIGIVHLGIGAFHRAHQAWYTHKLLTQQPGDWSISGISFRSPTVRNQLVPQNGFYTLLANDRNGHRMEVIGAVREVLCAPENSEAVVNRLCHSGIKIVSLTVTEKGYCHDPATGFLDQDHPQVVADLKNTDQPSSALGYLSEALHRLWKNNLPPFSIVSCDNLPSNGKVLKGLLIEFASLRDAGLARWIEDHVSCPSSMVDRIVPATTELDLQKVQQELGVEDQGVVVTEGFSQWILEDDFCKGRPDWEMVGVKMVDDVTPFEHMKLRMLNGTHSTLAYLGFLAGHNYVADTANDPDFQKLLLGMWQDEIIPTLSMPAGIDLQAYAEDLLVRYQNPELHHRLYQIAMDGSQKLPQRLLGTLRDHLDANRLPKRILLAIAAWMRYVTAIQENGEVFELQDPMAYKLQQIARESGFLENQLNSQKALEYVEKILQIEQIFGSDLQHHFELVQQLTLLLRAMTKNGVCSVLQQTIAA